MEQQSQPTGQQTGGQNIVTNILTNIQNRSRQFNEHQKASTERVVIAARQLLTAINEELQPGGPAYEQALIGLATCAMWTDIGIASPATQQHGGLAGAGRG